MDVNKAQEQEWAQKLKGRKFGSDSAGSDSFNKEDLPQKHRICKHGGLVTMDFQTDRLNVFLDADDKCTRVTYG